MAYGPAGIFLLCLLDSAGVPLPAGGDALVILLAARDRERWLLYAALAVTGSAIGNLFLFWTARKGGQLALDRKAPPGKTRRFREWFQRYGLLTVFIPALVPIPLPMKVFVLSAGAMGVRTFSFLWVVLLARVLRYGGEAYLAKQLGENSLQYVKDHVLELGLFSLALFVALYLAVRYKERRAKLG
jgi:membrane protein YqaA with SNARE-associated domain